MRQVRTYCLGRPEARGISGTTRWRWYFAPSRGDPGSVHVALLRIHGFLSGVGRPYREKARLIRLSLLGTEQLNSHR